MIANRNLLGYLLWIWLYVIAATLPSKAQTRIGLHVTKEELEIWKQRAVTGPYLKKGDVSENSPGDWTRIMGNADSFLENPEDEHYIGYTGKGCVPVDSKEPLNKAEKIRDAAFVYLITNDARYSTAVRKALLAQAQEESTDFSNKSLWCPNFLRDRNPGFFYATWMTRLLLAYDYIKNTVPASDKRVLEKWFYDAALYFQHNVDADMEKIWENRKEEDYRLTKYANIVGVNRARRITHLNGYNIPSLALWYNNRRAAMIMFVTLTGIHRNDKNLIQSGKLFVKEWLKYSTFHDGTIGEFERWTDKSPEQGWQYAMVITDFCIGIADHLARAGDMELYTYSTSEGKFGTQGGRKSIQSVAVNMLKYVSGSHNRYATLNPKNNNNINYRIDAISAKENKHYVFDSWVSQANIFYKNDFLKRVYLRKVSGTEDYPRYPTRCGAYVAWTGGFGTYPGKLFMFGQMEGKVWPYPKAAPTNDPPVDEPNLSTNQGGLTEELWKDVEGESVSQIPLHKSPSAINEITSFESASDIDDYYGRRIRGYVHPPVSGEYTFWIAGDDDCELWISTDDDPKNKYQIAEIKGWTSEQEWGKYASQRSVKIELKSGSKYYVEVLHKEHKGKDHVAVGWQLPDGELERPISSSRLSPYVIGNEARMAAVDIALETEFSLQVYPNPFQDQITVKTDKAAAGEAYITISDLFGKVLFQHTATIAAGESEILLDLSRENFKSGIYLLQVVTADNHKKLVKIVKP